MVLRPLPLFLLVTLYLGSGMAMPELDEHALSDVETKDVEDDKLTNEGIHGRNVSLDHPIVHQFVSDRPSEISPRRLQLYPQWFAKRIPQLLGKSFARRYFYPFGKSHNAAGRNKIEKTTNKEGIRRELLALAKSLPKDESEFHVPGISKQVAYLPLSQLLTGYQPSSLERVGAPNLDSAPDIPMPVSDQAHSYVGDPLDYQVLPQYAIPSYLQPVQPSVLQYPFAEALGNGEKLGEDWLSYLKAGHTLAHHHPCHHNPCLNEGHCHVLKHDRTKFGCKCKTGFSGRYCQVVQASCHPNPCFHGGTCTKVEHGYFCSCESDYKGSNCQLEAVCFKNPCQNGGICTELEDGYYCTCTKEFTGKDCAERVSPCTSNPCKNSGTCIARDETFTCKCNVGYVCDDCSCQVAINQTVSSSVSTVQSYHPKPCPFGYCKNGGTCFSTKEGPICTCPLAFKGVDCSAPNLCNPSPCDNGGICLQDGEENYKCICPYGFKGPNCEDQLSCMSHPCLNGGKCHETPTSFRCDCAQGFKGISCDQLSPCSKSPCEHSLACNEKGPLFACQCAEGYRGKSCQERDPCAPNPCANGVCHEIDGIRTCNCSVGWIGNFCEVTDQCHPNKCQNGGTCVHNGDHFHCICAEGFYGSHCQYPSPCLSNPCGRNGDCHITDYGYICICRDGFRGKLCDVRNKCHPNPCLNGGFCFEGDDDFICECLAGYTGRTCHIQDFCDPNPCRNGGSCFEKIGAFSCSCLSGYVGEKCEVDVCLPDPCKNGGTCVPSNTPHGYACECVFPFHGHNCLDSDPCQPNPCKNGGTCKNHLDGLPQEGLSNQEIHNDGEHVITIVQSEGTETAGVSSHDTQEEDTSDSHETTTKETHTPLHVIVHGDYHSDSSSDNSAPVAMHDGDETNHNAWVNEVEHFSASQNVHHAHNVPDWYYHNDRKSHIEEDSMHLNSRAKILRKPKNASKRSGGLGIPRLSRKTKPRLNLRKEGNLRKRSGVARASKKNSVLKPRQSLTTEQLVKRNQLAKRTLQDLYVCHCPVGFLGAHCQHPNFCQSSPCENGGTCMPRGNRYQCRCPIGFGGLNCDDYKPCEPNPCLNGGRCLLSHTIRGYYCECPRGFTGYVCEDVDHCVRKNPCLHNSKCTSTKQGVECKCRQRFTGPHCGVDKCRDCSFNATCHRGHCVCNAGFIGNGFRCQAIGDPCSPNPCENGGLCSIGEDGDIFDCSCRPGYKGSRCELPNPCVSTPCLHSGVCVDASNSKEKGIILIDHRDYKCFCPQGYRGRNCEETTLGACSSAPCQNSAICFDVSDENYGKKKFLHPDEYDCFCQRGYSGKNCEIRGFACHAHPCQNGGTCLDEEMLPDVSFDSHGYKCYCRQGFFGRNCEVNIASGLPCHSFPCRNQGRCVDIGNNEDPDLIFQDSTEFKCFCPAHFSGVKCEFAFPACAMNPCHHNGTCIDGTTHPDMNFDETGYHCLCGTGYEGKNCERQYAFASLEEEKMLRIGESTDNDEEGQIPLYIADSSSIGDGTAEALSEDVHHNRLKSSPWSVYKEGKTGHHVISLTKDSDEGHGITTVYHEKDKTSHTSTEKPDVHVISLSTDDGKPGGAGQVLEETPKIKHVPVVTEGETIRPIYIFSVNNGKITDPAQKVAEVANKGNGVSTIVHVKPDSGIPGGAAAIVDQVAKSLTLNKEGSQQVFGVYPDSKAAKGNSQILVIEKTSTTPQPTPTKTSPTTKPKITPDLASLAAAKQQHITKIFTAQASVTTATTTPPPTTTPAVKIDQAVMEYNEAAKQVAQQQAVAAQNTLTQAQAPPSNLIPSSLLTPQALSDLQGAVLNSLSGQPVPLQAVSLSLENPSTNPSSIRQPVYSTNVQPQQPAYPSSYIPVKPAARISIPNPISTNPFGRFIGVPAIQPRYYYISPYSAKKSKLPT